MRKIYLATSWKNQKQPHLVEMIKRWGHEVYDFRNPAPGRKGFTWDSISPDWQNWTSEQYEEALLTPQADEGFKLDFDAMQWSDTGLLLLPAGRSAHLELGWLAGSGRKTIIYTQSGEQPELMNRLATVIVSNLVDLEKELS